MSDRPAAFVPEYREILVHLNIELNLDDERGPDEVADEVLAALEIHHGKVPGTYASGEESGVTVALAEEV